MQDKNLLFWNTIQYFKFTEFDSPDEVLSGKKMNHEFIKFLDTLRWLSGVMFYVNSGYRTKRYNTKIKGSENSAHLRGLAADICAESNFTKNYILKACFIMGIPRIGIYEKHIHIDCDLSLPHPIVWWGKPYK